MAILNLKVKTEIFPSFYKKQTCCVNQGMRTTLLKKLENFLHTKVIKASNCMDCRNFSQDLSKILRLRYLRACYTLHKKIKVSIKDFCSKCDPFPNLLQLWSHLLKKSLMENFIFCAV